MEDGLSKSINSFWKDLSFMEEGGKEYRMLSNLEQDHKSDLMPKNSLINFLTKRE